MMNTKNVKEFIQNMREKLLVYMERVRIDYIYYLLRGFLENDFYRQEKDSLNRRFDELILPWITYYVKENVDKDYKNKRNDKRFWYQILRDVTNREEDAVALFFQICDDFFAMQEVIDQYQVEDQCSYVKCTVAAVIGEEMIRKLPEGEAKELSRNVLDLCWKWIEKRNNKSSDPWELCLYIDSENGIDLVEFAEAAQGEQRDIYSFMIGVVAYIQEWVLAERQIWERPEYLEAIDDEFYRIMLGDAIKDKICSYGENEIKEIFDYCNAKKQADEKVIFYQQDMFDRFLTEV